MLKSVFLWNFYTILIFLQVRNLKRLKIITKLNKNIKIKNKVIQCNWDVKTSAIFNKDGNLLLSTNYIWSEKVTFFNTA